MKLQNLTIIFVIIIIPVILLLSMYISTGIKTIKYQSLYDTGLLTATHDAIYAFEQNTARDIYAGNPERKRDILKSSVKLFEKSLANTCGISEYNAGEIEQYIPAIVFGMYDGFYMYAPSGVYEGKDDNGKDIFKYTHNLKNYVYYSETLEGIGKNSSDIIIKYSLDNYVTVSGDFKNDTEGYIIKQGYLIDTNNSIPEGTEYCGVEITEEDIDGDGIAENTDAINYYKEAYNFTNWFNANVGTEVEYLQTSSENNPEDEDSDFVQHKRTIIKRKIESVLNSSITAYSNRAFGKVYKMPKLTEEDWNKVYSNISMITFFQGKSIGLTNYNGYCVLNSTNSNEYVNPNLMYFIEGVDDSNHDYHDIRCEKIKNSSEKLIGYKIGEYGKKKVEELDENGEIKTKYEYGHKALACYECVNGLLKNNKNVHEYISEVGENIESAYWTSLARERYNQVHL